ncbi:MAG TPA: acetolactate synthase large subunit [Steroidobacteraceae bacterium]|nr:acetolactate synthase large subunit [Steroidobacteraceae bacterium]
MNGAQLLRDTLLLYGVDVCFANPGTSEMHFVAALDAAPRMRCVLGLQENIVTGAADGFARMADRPAVTLLHLGPGLANGLANLHNARRARVPVINVVGDHASTHLAYDAPLTSDIESLARPMSQFVRRVRGADDVQRATAEVYGAALSPPGVATLILPADAAWSEAAAISAPAAAPLPTPRQADAGGIRRIAQSLRDCRRSGRRPGLMLSGAALRAPATAIADRIAQACNARLLTETLSGRMERGLGRVVVGKIPYAIRAALEFLKDIDVLVLVGAAPPVGFFAYPGAPGRLTRSDCEHLVLCAAGEDAAGALGALAAELGVPAGVRPRLQAPGSAGAPSGGSLTAEAVCQVVAQLLPEGAIVCDEAVTAGGFLFAHSAASAAHDYLQNAGGAIGNGIPMAVGAAVACADRKVISVQADGSGMYTIQGLWTQARERLDVLTIVLANRAYAILQREMRELGVRELGENARRMLNLGDPDLDFVLLAQGMGVDAARARSVEDFLRLMRFALARRGPFLIEAVL